MSKSNESREKRDADHVWHVWLNRRNLNRPGGEAFDHSSYEFMSMMDFLEYGPRLIEQAFTGTLPTVHRHCSQSRPETIEKNVLQCAFGVDVTQCEILKSLRETFDEQRPLYDVPDGQVFRIMTNVCAHHMYTEPIKTGKYIDTSEGWVTDESDRRFWLRTYELMRMSPEDIENAS